MVEPPPSRASNPFATCWINHDALPYAPPSGAPLDRLVGEVVALRGVGAIVGPHGAGKSALLAEIARRVASSEAPVFLEGFERLPRGAQLRQLSACRDAGRAALVTLHGRLAAWRLGARVLAFVRPDEKLLERLFGQLTAGRETPVTYADAVASFARRRRNLRDVWFDLYDLHERRTHAGRTAPLAVAYSR